MWVKAVKVQLGYGVLGNSQGLEGSVVKNTGCSGTSVGYILRFYVESANSGPRLHLSK